MQPVEQPGDPRRPSAWDWLNAIFAPVPIIAYHHRRASLSLSHIFVLAASAFVSSMMLTFMSISLARDLLRRIALKGAGLDLPNQPLTSETFKSLQQAFISFNQLSREEKEAIVGQSAAQYRIINAAMKGTTFFGWFLIGCAFYVVLVARSNTRQAHRSFAGGSFAVPDKTMEPPKGRGSAWMSYAIAVMMPHVSYAIHCNHRLSFWGMSILTSFLASLFHFFGIVFFSLEVSFARDMEGVAPLLSYVLLVFLLAPLVVYIVGPVKMAVENVKAARAGHAKAAAVE